MAMTVLVNGLFALLVVVLSRRRDKFFDVIDGGDIVSIFVVNDDQ
jgi:hypothetical protein